MNYAYTHGLYASKTGVWFVVIVRIAPWIRQDYNSIVTNGKPRQETSQCLPKFIK